MTAEEQEWLGEILYNAEPTGRSAMIALVQNHWEGLRNGRRFPTRAEIDPTAIYNAPALHLRAADTSTSRTGSGSAWSATRSAGSTARTSRADSSTRWNGNPRTSSIPAHIYDRLYREAVRSTASPTPTSRPRPTASSNGAVFPLSDDGEHVTHAISIDDYTMVTPRGGKLF